MDRDFLTDLKKGKYKEDTLEANSNIISYIRGNVIYAIPYNSSEKLRRYVDASVIKYHDDEASFEEIINELEPSNYTDDKYLNSHNIVWFTIARNMGVCSNVLSEFTVNLSEKNTRKVSEKSCSSTQ